MKFAGMKKHDLSKTCQSLLCVWKDAFMILMFIFCEYTFSYHVLYSQMV